MIVQCDREHDKKETKMERRQVSLEREGLGYWQCKNISFRCSYNRSMSIWLSQEPWKVLQAILYSSHNSYYYMSYMSKSAGVPTNHTYIKDQHERLLSQ